MKALGRSRPQTGDPGECCRPPCVQESRRPVQALHSLRAPPPRRTFAVQSLLAYQPEPAVVLAEAHRVLKPGGLIYCREMIIESSFVHPDTPELARGWEIFADLLEADDGHPQIGKQLMWYLTDRGYRDLRLSLTFETYAENSSVERFHRLVATWFRSSEITMPVLQYEAGSAGELEQFDEALARWWRTPGAYAAIAFGQATARKSSRVGWAYPCASALRA